MQLLGAGIYMGKTRRRKGNNVVVVTTPSPQNLAAVRQNLANLLLIATDLYNICADAAIPELRDPSTWIMQQTTMRAYWAEIRPFLRQKEYDNDRVKCFYNYMEFMYVSYPAGFGDKIKELHDNDISFDGAEIYNYLNF
jgi:hypothetical protein